MVITKKFDDMTLFLFCIFIPTLRGISSVTSIPILALVYTYLAYLVFRLLLEIIFRKVVEIDGGFLIFRDTWYRKYKIELGEINSIKFESIFYEFYIIELKNGTKIKLKSKFWKEIDKIGFEEFFKDVLIKNQNTTTI